MAKVIIRRLLASLLCLSVFWCSFVVTASATSVSNDEIDLTYSYYPISLSGFSTQGLDQDFEAPFDFFDALTYTWGATAVTTGSGTIYDISAPAYNEKILELYNAGFPFGYSDIKYAIKNGVYIPDDDLLNYLVFPFFGDYENLALSQDYIMTVGTLGSLPYSFALSNSNVSLPTSFPRSVGYTSFPYIGIGLVSNSSTPHLFFSGFETEYYIYSNPSSHFSNIGVSIAAPSTLPPSSFYGVLYATRDISVFDPPLAPEGASNVYFSPNTGFNASKLIAKIGDDFEYFDGAPASDPTQDYGTSSGGGLNGDITVGGKIEVDGKVDVDVNVNVNDTASMPDFDVVENLPETPQNFIDYLQTLFDFLPGQVLALIVAAIACAVFCRIWGR